MDVSVVIVNYKTPKLLETCVSSVYKFTKGLSFEVIVIDNQSEDESKKLITTSFPEVVWVDMGYNSGFGRANNKGISKAKGTYSLLLNSDTELYEDSISLTVKHYENLELKNKKIGLLGCQIKHGDGRLQPSCNYYWAGIREAIEEHPFGIKILQKWFKIKKLRDIDKYSKLTKDHKMVWLGVPFALIKTDIIRNYLFDEHFFMYSEDEELNYRLSKKGYNSYYFAGTGVYHYVGASSTSSEKRQKQINYSKLLFILKSKGRLYFFLYVRILNSAQKWNKRLAKSSNVKNVPDFNEGKLAVLKTVNGTGSLNCYID